MTFAMAHPVIFAALCVAAMFTVVAVTEQVASAVRSGRR